MNLWHLLEGLLQVADVALNWRFYLFGLGAMALAIRVACWDFLPPLNYLLAVVIFASGILLAFRSSKPGSTSNQPDQRP